LAAQILVFLEGGEGVVVFAHEVGFVGGEAQGGLHVGHGGEVDGGLGVLDALGDELDVAALELVDGHADGADVGVTGGVEALGVEDAAQLGHIAGVEGGLDGGAVVGDDVDEVGAALVGGAGALLGLGDGGALSAADPPAGGQGTGEAPVAGGEGADEGLFGEVGGLELGAVGGVELGVGGGVLVALEGGRDDVKAGKDAVGDGVEGRAGLAVGRARAGGALGVAPVGGDRFRGHVFGHGGLRRDA